MKFSTQLICLASLVLGACSPDPDRKRIPISTYQDGVKRSEGYLKTIDVNDGHWTNWYQNGQKESEGVYKDGRKEGLWTLWDDNGKKNSEVEYIDGEEVSRTDF